MKRGLEGLRTVTEIEAGIRMKGRRRRAIHQILAPPSSSSSVLPLSLKTSHPRNLEEALEQCSRWDRLAFVTDDEDYIHRIGRGLFVNGFDVYVFVFQRRLPSKFDIIQLAGQLDAYLRDEIRLEGAALPHFVIWSLWQTDRDAVGYQLTLEQGVIMEMLVEAYYNGWLQPNARKHFLMMIAQWYRVPRSSWDTIMRSQWLAAVRDFCGKRGLTNDEFRAQRLANCLGKRWDTWQDREVVS